jgi:flagellar hook-length control protein FliK
MSQSISAMELVMQSSGRSGKAAKSQPDQQDNGTFAKLMGGSVTDAHADTSVAKAGPGGNGLPEKRTKPATDKDTGDPPGATQAGSPEPADKTPTAIHVDTHVAQDPAKPADQPPPADTSPSTKGDAAPVAMAVVPVVDANATTAVQPAPVTGSGTANTPPGIAAAAQQLATAAEQSPAPAAAAMGEALAHGPHKETVEQPAATTSGNAVAQSVHDAMLKLLQSQNPHGGGQQRGAGDRLLAAASSTDGGTLQTSASDSVFAQTLSGTGTGAAQPSAQVSVPVGQPGWGRAVGEQMMWFVSQNIRSASLRLNPQHLGPMEMQVHMDGDKASIAFASQHVMVRDALESALPRLREMFSANGLDLVNVNVSHQQDPGYSGGDPRSSGSGGGSRSGFAEPAGGLFPAAMMPETAIAQGLVDYYV